MHPPLRSTAPVVISLDVLMHEWRLMQRQHEESSSRPSRDAKQGKARHPDSARRVPLPYPFEVAARGWSREVPKLGRN